MTERERLAEMIRSANTEPENPSGQSDIADLIADIFTALELGWDIESVRKTEKTQARLGRVSATFDELVEIARHVENTYCEDCPLRYV